jgi:N-acetylglucosamine-6-sulfatase
MKLSLILACWLVPTITGLGQHPFVPTQHEKPNIVVILTDDQDLHMDSVDYMPLLKKHVIDHGTFYKHHFCSTAICCPSRVTLWTGRNAHNTNVTDVFPPYGEYFQIVSRPELISLSGGYPKFVAQGFNKDWLPLWLQSAGYSTYYTGKLFNAHTIENWNSPHPSGWTSSDFLLDPHTYQYLNASFQRNQYPPVSYQGQYSTDILAEKAFGLLYEGIESGNPFFLTVAPVAPHSNVDFPTNGTPEDALKDIYMTAPIPAERHKHLFPDAKVPRRSNFNPEKVFLLTQVCGWKR